MNIDLLTKLRHEINATRRDVSLATGITENQIYLIESGQSQNPTLKTISALANFYGVSIAELVGEQNEGGD